MKKEGHSWSVIGLNENETHIEINAVEYRLEKSSAAIVHAIMCLTDSIEEIGNKIDDIRCIYERR